MKLPFYLSYKEFESHYYDNLEKWFEEYQNGSEIDYLKSLSELYSPYLYYNFGDDKLQADATLEIKDCFFPYYERMGISFCTSCDNGKRAHALKKVNHLFEWKTVTMIEYAQYILDKVNGSFSKKGISKENENVLDYINNDEVISFREGAGYCINYHQHQTVVPFLTAYLPCYGQTVDITVYREFIFSIVQIADHIDKRLKEIQAFEHTIYAKLKSEAKFKVQMSHQFLMICN